MPPGEPAGFLDHSLLNIESVHLVGNGGQPAGERTHAAADVQCSRAIDRDRCEKQVVVVRVVVPAVSLHGATQSATNRSWAGRTCQGGPTGVCSRQRLVR